MPEQFLHGADVVAVFEEMGRKRMAHTVRADVLEDARGPRGICDRLLHHRLVDGTATADPTADRDRFARPETRIAISTLSTPPGICDRARTAAPLAPRPQRDPARAAASRREGATAAAPSPVPAASSADLSGPCRDG